MKDTGIEEKVNGLFAPISADNKLSAKMAQIGEKFLPTLRDRRNSFLYTVYLVILRISQTLIWLWPLGLFAVPLIIDLSHDFRMTAPTKIRATKMNTNRISSILV